MELDFESKEFDLAIFHAEQAAQLFLKSKILSLGVQFPKIYEISELMKILHQLGMKRLKVKK